MTGKTHKIVGVACTLPLLHYTGLIGIFGIIGSTFADIDLRLGIKHRTITHNLLFCFAASGIVFYINRAAGFIFFINYLVHLILDSMTVMGIAWFYPFSKKYYSMRLCKCGSEFDDGLFLLTLLGVVMYCSYWFINH